jgi:hypothetical protein
MYEFTTFNTHVQHRVDFHGKENPGVFACSMDHSCVRATLYDFSSSPPSFHARIHTVRPPNRKDARREKDENETRTERVETPEVERRKRRMPPRPQGVQRNQNADHESLATQLRNARRSIGKLSRFSGALRSENTRLQSVINALRSVHGRAVSTQPPSRPQEQSKRNDFYHRYKGLLSVIKEINSPKRNEYKHELARKCWFETIIHLFRDDVEEEIQKGIDAISRLMNEKEEKEGDEQAACIDCCICYEPIEQKDCLIMPNCWHNMHSDCYLDYARSLAKNFNPCMPDRGLFDSSGEVIPEFIGMFPRLGTCPCPEGRCMGHDKESYDISIEERENAISERGPTGETSVDPFVDGDGFMKLTRTRKQLFAISGATVINHLPFVRFTERQKRDISLHGFYVDARLPGRGGDAGVCCPPAIASYNDLQNVDMKNLSPPVARSTLNEIGVKGYLFKISDLPSDWEWDELPADSSLRLTKETARDEGGTLKLDLSFEFVKQHNESCVEKESRETAVLRRSLQNGTRRRVPRIPREETSEEEGGDEEEE